MNKGEVNRGAMVKFWPNAIKEFNPSPEVMRIVQEGWRDSAMDLAGYVRFLWRYRCQDHRCIAIAPTTRMPFSTWSLEIASRMEEGPLGETEEFVTRGVPGLLRDVIRCSGFPDDPKLRIVAYNNAVHLAQSMEQRELDVTKKIFFDLEKVIAKMHLDPNEANADAGKAVTYWYEIQGEREQYLRRRNAGNVENAAYQLTEDEAKAVNSVCWKQMEREWWWNQWGCKNSRVSALRHQRGASKAAMEGAVRFLMPARIEWARTLSEAEQRQRVGNFLMDLGEWLKKTARWWAAYEETRTYQLGFEVHWPREAT